MTSPKIAKTLPRTSLLLCTLFFLVQQGSRALPLPTDALRFFNNFFVTGDVVVAGVGLWQNGIGTIDLSNPAAPMSAATDGDEALAAYLYWQVVTPADLSVVDVNDSATFNGLALSHELTSQPTAVQNLGGTDACPINGGNEGVGNKVHTYRADVLRFMDVDTSGKRVINKVGGYPVTFPSTATVKTLGASLVVIYRDSDPAKPLSGIVLYDGVFTKQQQGTMSQTIEGFYDPAAVSGQITYITGSAQSGLGDRLTGPFATQNDLFDGALGQAWDNVTRTTNSLAGASSFPTTIAPRYSGLLSFLNDCISVSAIVYRTQVNDTDGDGLLNRWETLSGLVDPNGRPLPNLAGMGALPDHRDIFIEVEAMRTGPTTYGSEAAPLSSTHSSVEDLFGHNHMPTPAALKMLGDAYAAAPGGGIALHVDVGDLAAYHALVPPNLPMGEVSPFTSTEADAYLIGTGAQGGEVILETACTPDPGAMPEVDCQFPDYPGTVSWPTGFQLYKSVHFDQSRKDTFRFALYAHAKATPKSLLPCLGDEGEPAGFDLDPDTGDGECASGMENPLIHVPAGVSGTAHFPGADILISLGLWDNTNFVGGDLGVAATTMHEFGHTFGLGHGGEPLPNCKPNYLSVMNYMFQLGGLIDKDGVAHLGYSDTDLIPVNEVAGLSETYTVPGPYRTSWYAPKLDGDTRTAAKRFCNGLRFDPASPPVDTVRIEGSFDGSGVPIAIDWNANGTPGENDLTQDVNFDGEPGGVAGGPPTTLTGFNDWANLRLNQIGSRQNFAGLSIGPLGVQVLADGSQILADGSQILADGSRVIDGAVFLNDGSVFLNDGSVFLNDGSVFLNDGSVFLNDGSVFLNDGSVFLNDGSVPLADGSVLLSSGAVFLSDGAVFLNDGAVFLNDGVSPTSGVTFLADGAVFLNDGTVFLNDGMTFAWDIGKTPEAAAESGNTPGPTSLTACVIGVDCPSGTPPGAPSEPLHRVWLDWEAPTLGNVLHYVVYRVVGDTIIPDSEAALTEVPGSQTFLLDENELPNGTTFPPGTFTYIVEAVLDDEGETVTPPSNSRTITAVNEKPTGNAQTVQVWEDSPSPITLPSDDPIITLTGDDVDSAEVVAFSAQTNSLHGGTVTPSLPNVSYTSALNYNGADSFTFTVKEDSTWNDLNQESDPATITLTVNPVNDEPSFTKGSNQTVTQPTGAQTVAGWATGFDAGPPDEDASQSVLRYIVSNDNNGLFSVQPAIATDGTLTYTPMAGASGSATVTVQVQDNGGTIEGHGADDTSGPQTFTITVLPPPLTISFQRNDVWFTTSSANRKFDIKAEVLKNGVPVREKILFDQTVGSGTTFNKAVYKQIGNFAAGTVGFTASDTLSVRVSMKVSEGSAGGTSASGAIRLWYNIPTPPGNDSHLHATRNGTEVKYYMIAGNSLQKGGVVVGPTLSIADIVYKAARNLVEYGSAYKVIGTWSMTNP